MQNVQNLKDKSFYVRVERGQLNVLYLRLCSGAVRGVGRWEEEGEAPHLVQPLPHAPSSTAASRHSRTGCCHPAWPLSDKHNPQRNWVLEAANRMTSDILSKFFTWVYNDVNFARYSSLLLELRWPFGRLVRHFTVGVQCFSGRNFGEHGECNFSAAFSNQCSCLLRSSSLADPSSAQRICSTWPKLLL